MIRHFMRDDRGSVAMLFALMLVPMIGFTGLAIDYGRAARLKAQLQIVADAATSAGLNEYRETGDIIKGQTRLLAFVDQGLAKDGMVRAREENNNGASVSGKRVVYVDGSAIDPATSSVRPVLKTTIDTPIMSLLGSDSIDIEVFTKGAVASDVLEGTKDLELALVLDLSGSMGGTSDKGKRKIDDMKVAAKDFLDIVMPDDAAAEHRRVGLVPFSHHVNVGSYVSAATGLAAVVQAEYTNEVPVFADASTASWASLSRCRYLVQSVIDYMSYTDSQATNFCNAKFQRRVVNGQTEYLVPELTVRFDPFSETLYLNTCVTERQGQERYTDAAPGPGAYAGVFWPGSEANYTNLQQWKCAVPEIKTLTTDKQSLKDHIETFKPVSATAGHVGTAWSYYMLSPEWNRFWSNGHMDVSEYDNTKTIKAAVLMTDGMFNASQSEPDAPTQAIAICNEMKGKGITIYAIGFDMSKDENDPARQTLVSCASPGKYYFPYDGDALRKAFKEIGKALVTIVTKSSDTNTVLIQE